MMTAIALFLLAGVAEIGGGYLVWLWLRESKPMWYGIAGGAAVLVAYGIIPTFQSFPNFGRVYAAYGYLLCYPFCGDGGSTKRLRIFTTGLEPSFALRGCPSCCGLPAPPNPVHYPIRSRAVKNTLPSAFRGKGCEFRMWWETVLNVR